MQTKEYNGWTNYETWLVKLWMDNEEGSCNFWQEETKVCFRDAKPDPDYSWTKDDKARVLLAACLKDKHEETIYDAIPKNLHASFIMDLLNGALSEVNWNEIAESLLDTHCEDYGKAQAEPAAA